MSRAERRLERLGGGVRRRVQDRVAVATGMDELTGLEESVDSLEVAVHENSALEVPLTAIVDALERDVAAVLERRTDQVPGRGMGA